MAESSAIDPKVLERLRELIDEAEASRAEGPSITIDELFAELKQKRAEGKEAPPEPLRSDLQ